MKRLIALFTAMMMLALCVCAVAEDKITVFTDEATGAKVTLEMQGEYYIEFDQHSGTEYVQFDVSRDGVAPVTVMISAIDAEGVNMNDMTEEQLQQLCNYLAVDEDSVVTVEETESGNKYINILIASEEGSIQERYTVFEGFDMSRVQFKEGIFTEEDTAFLAEVQSGLWVE